MPVRLESVKPHLHVPDVVVTAQYYERVLGFQVEGYWDGERVHHDPRARVVFGIVRRDGVRLHLNRVPEAAERTAGEDAAYDLYFDASDVDALAAELRERGAEIVEGPTERSYGAREVVVRDCDGRVLAFGAPA